MAAKVISLYKSLMLNGWALRGRAVGVLVNICIDMRHQWKSAVPLPLGGFRRTALYAGVVCSPYLVTLSVCICKAMLATQWNSLVDAQNGLQLW